MTAASIWILVTLFPIPSGDMVLWEGDLRRGYFASEQACEDARHGMTFLKCVEIGRAETR